MRRIIVGAMVSLDGVMQSPGGQTEDPTEGFTLGGWVMPHFDEMGGEEVDGLFKGRDLLLGRKTYEIFAAYWPYQDENAPHGNITRQFNRIGKFVVSRSGDVDLGWSGSLLVRDIAALTRLKQQDGPDLVTQGSTELVQALFANDLVDALSLFMFPVVIGGGKKLFADGSVPHAFALKRSCVTPAGVFVGHYERAGVVPIGDAGLGSPSDRELARRMRMAREG